MLVHVMELFQYVIRSLTILASSGSQASSLLANIDESVDPCNDFYEYACGQWQDNNMIPDDKSLYGNFDATTDRVQQYMKTLLESSKPMSIGLSKAVDMTRKYYQTCLDTEALAKIKSTPLYEGLKELGDWPTFGNFNENAFDFSRLVSKIESIYTTNAFWSVDVSPDNKNARKTILFIDQPQLALESRDFYLNDSLYGEYIQAYKKLLQSSVSLIAQDAGLLSINEKMISDCIDDAYAFERQLANITTPDENRRNHSEMYNVLTAGQLKTAATFFNWDSYFDLVMPSDVRPLITDATEFVMVEPEYFKKLNNLIASTKPRQLANFIMVDLIGGVMGLLDERFVNLRQEFLKVFEGRQSRPARWKSCVMITINTFRQGAGALYVDKHFPEADKREALKMINNLLASLENMIKDLTWMDSPTKSSALTKLFAMASRIGYPEMVKNVTELDNYYEELDVAPSDGYYELHLKVGVSDQRRAMRKLLKPTDRSEFSMSPALVNAYYDPTVNSMSFPAAILQPPFFRGDFPKAVNYGAMGVVIGHELTHGFDDEGSQYDEDGNLKNWWSVKSSIDFHNRTKCIVDQYSSYRSEEVKLSLNGKTTQGENIADNGGIKEAFRAYQNFITLNGDEPLLPGLNKTNEQVFFLSYASVWCTNVKPQALMKSIISDVHSPGRFRVTGPLSNLEEFSRAFGCKPGTSMNPLQSSNTKCEVW